MIDIRPMRAEELGTYFATAMTGFQERRDPGRLAEEMAPLWDLTRHLVALDGGRMCGTFRSWASEITVPGGAQLAATCISGVAVLASHRGQGILRRFVAAEHAAARERGEPLALLYASQYPIYGRFGYGMATRQATWTLDASSPRFHDRGRAFGAVEVGVPTADDRDGVMGVYEAWRRARTGELRRNPYSWDYDLGLRESAWGDDWKGFLVTHRAADGTVDGYALYTVDGRWEQRNPANIIKIDELHALTDEASADLWAFLASMDWVASVVAERRSPSDRLPWLLTDARAAVVSDLGDALFVHLLDIPRALEGRTYAGEGRLLLEVIDGAASQRFELTVSPDGARCTPSDGAPDLTLAADALGAAYLGGTRLRDATLARGADEHRSGALATLESWLRTPDEPWCSTFF